MEIPDLRTVLRHSAPRFAEGTLIPLALFATFLRIAGVWGAMIAGLAWVYTAVGVRVVMRRRVPALLVLGAVTITARTVVALLSGSVVVYFLQPSLGTVLVGAAFLVSVALDRPLAGRLANDFCPLPPEVRANAHVRRFFRQISLLWAFTQLCNAGITVWLLLSQSVGTFVVLRTVVSMTVTVTAITASALWFKKSMARHGILVTLPSWRAAGASTSGT